MKLKLKRHINLLLIPGLLLALAPMMQSCVNDTYPDVMTPGNDPGEGGVKRYLAITLANADGSGLNPGDHEFGNQDGTDFEHRIDMSGNSDNVIIFFNDDMTYYGYTTVDYDHAFSQGTETGYRSEISYVGVIHSPDPDVIFNLPANGLVVLNAHNITDALDNLRPGATIDDVLLLTDDSSDARRPGLNGVYHTLTSVAYMEPEGGEWKHSILFKINPNKIYETRMQAAASPATQAVVERMSSKFSITLPGARSATARDFVPDNGRAQVIVCDYTDGHANYNNRTWTCTADAWGINKYETSSYYFRNIVGEGARTSSYPYTYGADINSTGLPFFNGWNDYTEHRAYWGRDPHYEDGVYPRQVRPAIDNTELDYYGFKGKPSLGYISYNEMSDFSRLGTQEGEFLYSNENTFPDTRIGGLWQHDLAGSELLVGARLHISGVNENKADYDLFRNRIGVFYPSVTDFATYFIQTFNTQLTSQSTMTYRYYDWANPANNSSGVVTETLKLNHDNYKLYYGNAPLTPEVMASLINCTLAATVESGDGKVIPWVEGMYIGRRDIDPNTYEEVGDIQRLSIQPNNFKSLIYDWVGAFDHFNKGRMVYAVPILHRATAEKVSSRNYRPAVGDYGVARNMWYSFAVMGINTLGAPVDDLNQKIIVYQSSLENSIMVEIKVLDWHLFSTDVTLPDKLK